MSLAYYFIRFYKFSEIFWGLFVQNGTRIDFFIFITIDFCISISYNSFGDTKGGEHLSEKKIGRPTDNPKNISVRIRMDKTTVEKLDKCCEIEKLNRSEMIRESIHRAYDSLEDK